MKPQISMTVGKLITELQKFKRTAQVQVVWEADDGVAQDDQFFTVRKVYTDKDGHVTKASNLCVVVVANEKI